MPSTDSASAARATRLPLLCVAGWRADAEPMTVRVCRKWSETCCGVTCLASTMTNVRTTMEPGVEEVGCLTDVELANALLEADAVISAQEARRARLLLEFDGRKAWVSDGPSEVRPTSTC